MITYTYRFQENERLGQEVAQKVIVSQSDTLKITGGVDLLKEL